VHKELKVFRELLVLRVLCKELLDQMDQQGHKVHKVFRVQLQELLVELELLEPKVLLEQQEDHKVRKVRKGPQVHKVLLEQQEVFKVHKGYRELATQHRAQPGHQEDLLELKVQEDHKVPKEVKVFKELQELEVHKGLKEQKPQAHKEHKVQEVHKGLLDPKDHLQIVD
jgi:hypothetical protein